MKEIILDFNLLDFFSPCEHVFGILDLVSPASIHGHDSVPSRSAQDFAVSP